MYMVYGWVCIGVMGVHVLESRDLVAPIYVDISEGSKDLNILTNMCVCICVILKSLAK